MRVHWLGEPACHERARVGGKAAALSRLAGRHRVPDGQKVEGDGDAGVVGLE